MSVLRSQHRCLLRGHLLMPINVSLLFTDRPLSSVCHAPGCVLILATAPVAVVVIAIVAAVASGLPPLLSPTAADELLDLLQQMKSKLQLHLNEARFLPVTLIVGSCSMVVPVVVTMS